MRYLYTLFFTFTLLIPEGFAQLLDPDFKPAVNGRPTIFASEVQADGKLLIGGNFSIVNNKGIRGIARLDGNTGALDPTFNVVGGIDGIVYALAIQPDGKILAGGSFKNARGIARNGLVRFNADGTVDNSFTVGSGVSICGKLGSVNAIKVQSDGKILIGGLFDSYNGAAFNSIARLNADGTVDAGFDAGTGAMYKGKVGAIFDIEIMSDTIIMAGGIFDDFNGFSHSSITQLDPDGSVDTVEFDLGKLGLAKVFDLDLDRSSGPPPRLVVGGQFRGASGQSYWFSANVPDRCCFVGPAGGFGNIANPDGPVFAIAADTIESGIFRHVIGGGFRNVDGESAVGIANSFTSPDFDGDEGIGGGIVTTISFDRDTSYFVGGNFTFFSGSAVSGLMKIGANTTQIDSTFSATIGARGTVRTLAVQPDGKILVGGNFTSVDGQNYSNIVRLNAEGTLDDTFSPGSGADEAIRAISLQSDGKIVVGGSFTYYNGDSTEFITRLNVDGSEDMTTSPEVGANKPIYAITSQPDDKVLIGGYFTTWDEQPINYFARLNADGSLDNAFNTGSGPNDGVKGIALQADGKAIIIGTFNGYNGTSAGGIARVNTDGTLDNTFAIGNGADGEIQSVAIQSDGKVIIGGNFKNFNGIAAPFLARLNADGSLDNTFDTGTGPNFAVNAVGIDATGRILIGGFFSEYNGELINNMARLNPDGTLDPIFEPGSGPNNFVNTIVPQGDNFLLGGSFTAFNSVIRTGIARIESTSGFARDSTLLVELFENTDGQNWVDNTNWTSGNVSGWTGVTLTDNRVSAIRLIENGLDGPLPESLASLSNLDTIDLSNNELTSLPDMTSLEFLNVVDVRENKLEFADIVPNLSIPGFVFEPQKPFGQPLDTAIDVGLHFRVSLDPRGDNNIYQWELNTDSIPDADTTFVDIDSIRFENMGNYVMKVANTGIDGVTLESENQRVLAQADIIGMVLNPDGGPRSSAEAILLDVQADVQDIQFDTAAIAQVVNGDMTFEDAILGDYTIGVLPLTAQADIDTTLFSTYWGDGIFWETAATLAHRKDTLGADVRLVSVPDTSVLDGEGLITGFFEFDDGLPPEDTVGGNRIERRRRVGRARVTISRARSRARLLQEGYVVVAVTFTDENGEFEFPDLPDDVYRINIQLPGFPMDSALFDVEVDSENFSGETNVEAFANPETGKIEVTAVQVTGIFERKFKSIKIFPIPATTTITIEPGELRHKHFRLTLTNLSGQIVWTGDSGELFNKGPDIRIDVGNLENGIYILNLFEGFSSKNSIRASRIIIQK